MRVFVISDIHGRHSQLEKLLAHSKVDFDRDAIYFLGDYIDRGPDSLEVLRCVKKLDEAHENVHCAIGNHDYMMFKSICGGKYSMSIYDITFDDQWLLNGKERTMQSLRKAGDRELADICIWLSGLAEQFEITVNDKKYVLTHSQPRLHEKQSVEEMLWARVFGKQFDWSEFKAKYPDTTLVSGHTPVHHITENSGLNKVYFGKGIPYINVDCGAGRIGANTKARLALLNLTSKRAIYAG